MPKKKAPRTAWIADIQVSAPVAHKIRSKHGLDPDEIVALVLSPPPRLGRYVTDDRGSRLYVTVGIAGNRTVLVVLHPFGDDVWGLASAYVQDRPRRA